MVRPTLAHAQTNYHVSQFGQSNQEKLTSSNIGKQLACYRDQKSKIAVCTYILPQTPEPPASLRRNPISIW
jgi:hypothetical protein